MQRGSAMGIWEPWNSAGISMSIHVHGSVLGARLGLSCNRSCFSVRRNPNPFVAAVAWAILNKVPLCADILSHAIWVLCVSAASSWNKMIFIPAVRSQLHSDELKWLLGRVTEGGKNSSLEDGRRAWFVLIFIPREEKGKLSECYKYTDSLKTVWVA